MKTNKQLLLTYAYIITHPGTSFAHEEASNCACAYQQAADVEYRNFLESAGWREADAGGEEARGLGVKKTSFEYI